MCKNTKTFIQNEVEGQEKTSVKPIHSATLEEQFSGKKLELPCGKCAYCQIQYQNVWANRCSLEAKYYEYNKFITLTYAPEHLPRTKHINKKTGEIYYTGSLVKDHLKKFIKAIRNYYYRKYKHTGIKFFACGEYGEKRGRPHYHVIMFNLPVKDAEYDFTNEEGHKYYKSKTIEDIWGRGRVVITDYSWSTASYVARYITKRPNTEWDKTYYQKRNQIKEYVIMSNGIGKRHFEENIEEIMDNDKVRVYQTDKIVYPKIFKYYMRLAEEKYGYEERVKEIKEKRERDGLARIKWAEEEGMDKTILKNNSTYYAELEISKRRNKYEEQWYEN